MKSGKKIVGVLVMGLMLVSLIAATSKAGMRKDILSSTTELPADDCFNVIAEPFEWGMDVTRLLVNNGDSVNKADVKAEDFTVNAQHRSEQAMRNDTEGPRKILDAYPVDEQGNRVDDSKYIVIELEYGKDVQAAHMGSYNYANYYTPLTPKYELSKGKKKYTQSQVTKLVVDEFMLARHIDNSVEDAQYNFVDYGLYAPKADGTKKPLIIFFHGMGEGGGRDLKNQGVQLYAYQEEYFAEKEIQDIMGGSAYVLLPQSPDRWPTAGFTAESAYLQVVTNLIDTVIAENPDIDTNRIYIGGLSMGGYMASRMIINYPERFAAAFLCSQAYAITAEDAEKLKDLPIWVNCSEVDGTCAMDPYTYASYEKLKEAGNTSARCAVLKSNRQDPTTRLEFFTPDSDEPTTIYIPNEVENTKTGDLTWNNNTYGGHEAGWILAFNNKEFYYDENGKEVTIMEWVASNSLVKSLTIDTSKVKTQYKVGEAFSADGLAVTAVKRDGTNETASGFKVTGADTSKAGTQKVTVTYSGISATYDITVTGASAAATQTPQLTNNVKVAISDTKLVLFKKGYNKYTVSAEVTGSTDAVVWTSSNTKVATVDAKGVITAKSAGSAVIKATVAGVSSECTLIVKNGTFKLAKKSLTVKKGKSVKIKVTVSPKKKVSYKVSNKKIAKVTSKGVVKGLKKGTVKITVTYQGVKQIVNLKVK